MTAPLCFIDTETDGLHPGRKAWEVGMIRRDDRGEHVEHLFLPIDLATADPAALRIGKFYDRHPLGRRLSGSTRTGSRTTPLPLAAAAIARMTHGAKLVGAVPSFDAEILDRLLREQGFIPAWHYRLMCVESLTAGHLGREAGGLAKCAAALGLPDAGDDAHTALGDARTAAAIWDAIVGAGAAVQLEGAA